MVGAAHVAALAIAVSTPEADEIGDPFETAPLEQQVKVLRVKRVHRLRAKVVKAAKSRLGLPYVYGAAGPWSFDCSGLAQWSYKQIGKLIPRTTYGQRYVGKEVGIRSLRRGDLVFSYGDGHVEVYAGHGLVVVAPHSGTDVQEQSLWSLPFSGARRIIRKKP